MKSTSAFKLRFLSLVVAALCASGAQAQLAPGALPTGGNVAAGQASIVQNGTTLNIHQTSAQALVNFSTFNVGSAALVDIRQPGAAAALLARVTGSDPSQIYGQIKANGALWLINPAGIMVGAGARIDVGSFIASTLNVSDTDFLAGRLTFSSAGNAGPVHNAGAIRAASGGSIYLVAPNVTNTGTLTAPQGEVILAAGQNVQLIDTGTPGVSVAIGGANGEAKNLGRIAAEAGRIGLAAGLVTNGGTISASSAVSEGGRVFLRASNDLKTTAASDISANGTSGGHVALVAEGAAAIDGRVSATGSAGPGGFVETSGHRTLDVTHAPTVGRGGSWLIDPLNLEVVAGNGGSATVEGNVIVSNANGTTIGADVIADQLNGGASVFLETGGEGPDVGNITVSAAIAKTSGEDAALTLFAHNNIVINAPITSTAGALALNLHSNRFGDVADTGHAATLNANLDLNGGVLTVSQGEALGNGTLNILGGTTTLNNGTSAINAAVVNVGSGATVSIGSNQSLQGAWTNGGNVELRGDGSIQVESGGSLVNNGTLTLAGDSTFALTGSSETANLTNNGTIAKTSGSAQEIGHLVSGSAASLQLQAGQLTLDSSTLGGQVTVANGSQLVLDATTLAGGTAFSGAGAMKWEGTLTMLGDVEISAGPTLTTSQTLQTFINGSGYKLTSHNLVNIDGGTFVVGNGATWDNRGTVNVGGAQPGVLAFNVNAAFNNKAGGLLNVNDGSRLELSTTTTIGNEAGATLQVASTNTSSFSGGYTGRILNAGEIVKTGIGSTPAPVSNLAGGTIRVAEGGFGVAFTQTNANAGTIDIASGATLQSVGQDLYNAGAIRGTGTIALGGPEGATLHNDGVVAPGGSDTTGTLSIQGSYAQGPNGSLNIRLGANGSDVLDVDGSAQLGGTLNLSSLGGAMPTNGAIADFVVARGPANGGTFSQVNAPAVVGENTTGTLAVSYPAGGAAVARVTASTLPSLSVCSANPETTGCLSVLPTIDQCIANGQTAGCSAVLPTPAVCLVSPSTKGCAPVTADPTPTPTPGPVLPPVEQLVTTPPSPPMSDICVLAPASALCLVLSPSTQAEAIRPVVQASNAVVTSVLTSAAPGTVRPSNPTNDGGAATAADATGTKNDPAKKTYCN